MDNPKFAATPDPVQISPTIKCSHTNDLFTYNLTVDVDGDPRHHLLPPPSSSPELRSSSPCSTTSLFDKKNQTTSPPSSPSGIISALKSEELSHRALLFVRRSDSLSIAELGTKGSQMAATVSPQRERNKALTRRIGQPQHNRFKPSVVEISPITFSSNSELKNRPMYRLIKHAPSYHQFLLAEPSRKRRKVARDSKFESGKRVYAPRTASLRRAESLTTTSELESSPESESGKRSLFQRRTERKTLTPPVPIIAPPENHTVKLTVTLESSASLRIKAFLKRELDQRRVEGLSSDLIYAGRDTTGLNLKVDSEYLESVNKATFWENALCIGRVRRLKTIQWLLNVQPMSSENTESRRLPCSRSSFGSSGSSSTSATTECGDATLVANNLVDQLQTSRETRFHACWMFLRYFYLVMISESLLEQGHLSSSDKGEYHAKIEREGRELLVMDISIACLSLSVKFHRDFLSPLLPVYAHEYLALSPHGMSYDDLETTHRDILSTFRYRLGVSPQLLMDELWIALPSLRKLLSFEQGWIRAMDHAWATLFRAVGEADVQIFSVSLLTTVAIMDGATHSLQSRYESTITAPCLGPPGSPFLIGSSIPQEQVRKEAEHVLNEMQALVGFSDMQLGICRLWFKRVNIR